MEKILYFEDVDAEDVIVRKKPGMIELEYISKKVPIWRKTEPNSAYEREIYLGQGNCCLFSITEEEALRRISQW